MKRFTDNTVEIISQIFDFSYKWFFTKYCKQLEIKLLILKTGLKSKNSIVRKNIKSGGIYTNESDFWNTCFGVYSKKRHRVYIPML